MKRTLLIIALLLLSFGSAGSAGATFKPEYKNNPTAVQEWFQKARPTPPAAIRLGIDNCCNQAERLMTKFVNFEGHMWMYYADPSCTIKGCKLLVIPNDVVHEDNIHAENPDDDKLPQFDEMRAQGVLFIYNGRPSCFWPPTRTDN